MKYIRRLLSIPFCIIGYYCYMLVDDLVGEDKEFLKQMTEDE